MLSSSSFEALPGVVDRSPDRTLDRSLRSSRKLGWATDFSQQFGGAVDEQMRVEALGGTLDVMSVVEVVHQLGGVAPRATLVRLVGRSSLDRAITAGDVIRLARGRYGLPELDAALAVAARLNGVLCLTDAASYHGWEVKEVSRLPRTSWCRSGARSLIADRANGPGCPQMRRVASEASGLAANPFESVLRAIAMDVPGLSVKPQVQIGPGVRPDLVDDRLRIVLEADSFEWHGGRSALARDARRYNTLVVDGWLVLQFAWEDVMHDPRYVRAVLVAATALAEMLTKATPRRQEVA